MIKGWSKNDEARWDEYNGPHGMHLRRDHGTNNWSCFHFDWPDDWEDETSVSWVPLPHVTTMEEAAAVALTMWRMN